MKKRRVVVTVVTAALVAGCGEATVGDRLPAEPPSITGTLTSVAPFVPRTEDCVDPSDRPPDEPVSSDDQPLCTDASTDVLGTVLVEEHPERPVGGPGQPAGEGDKAMVTVAAGSDILVPEGDGYAEGEFADLEVGQLVEAWFTGPVAESYPVQARAGTVVVRRVAE